MVEVTRAGGVRNGGRRGVWFADGGEGMGGARDTSSVLAIESSFFVLLPTHDLRSIATYRLLSSPVPLCVTHSLSLRVSVSLCSLFSLLSVDSDPSSDTLLSFFPTVVFLWPLPSYDDFDPGESIHGGEPASYA